MTIKWIYRIVIIVLLLIAVGFYLLNFRADNSAGDQLLRTHQVNEKMWLYVTKSQSGDTTVPTMYRYYLVAEMKGSDEEIIKHLAEGFPFLTGTGTISDINVGADHRVNITYSGRVFSLSNSESFNDSGKQTVVNFSYRIN